MKKLNLFFFVLAAIICLQGTVLAEDVRQIRLVEDDAQDRFVSRLFELKYVSPSDIYPFIRVALKRYQIASTIQRVTSTNPEYTGGLLISTVKNFMPYIAEIISVMDKPGKKDANGSLIENTGEVKVCFIPKYRSPKALANLTQYIFGSSEATVFATGTRVYVQDQLNSALAILRWLEYLDRPLPQAEVRINYYELRESTLRDVGFDYLAWKNGPGVNLFNVGYNAGHLAVDEAFKSLLTNMGEIAANFSTSWGYGGFFTAPAFDMSFIRVLQQSGAATVAGHASINVLNTAISTEKELNELYALEKDTPYKYSVSITPQYQNIQKTAEGRGMIGYMEDNSKNEFTIYNPVVCFGNDTGRLMTPLQKMQFDLFVAKNGKQTSGGVSFYFDACFKNVVERGDTGQELSNTSTLSGSVLLPYNQEQVLAVYEKDTEVEQIIGFPFFGKLPVLKYICSTTTTTKEHTYIVITAEANLLDLERAPAYDRKNPEIIPQVKRDTHEPKTQESLKWDLLRVWHLD